MLSLLYAFHYFRVSRVCTNGNYVAYLLTKHAQSIEYYVTWIEENLYFLEHALSNDVISFCSC